MAQDIDMKINKDLLSGLFDGQGSLRKKASDERLNTWLRTIQRADGIARKMTAPTPVTENDFATGIVTTDAPAIPRQKMPQSAGAISANFDTGTYVSDMHAPKYLVYLQTMWTPKYRIDKIYLTAYNGPLEQIFRDLLLMDLLEREDRQQIDLYNASVGVKNTVNTDTESCRFIEAGSEVSRASIAHALKGLLLTSNNLTPSKVLCSRVFWLDIVAACKATEVGNNLAEQTLTGQQSALEDSLMNVKWVSTIRHDIVQPHTLFIVAPNENLGDFITYGDSQVITEVIDDTWLTLLGKQIIGQHVANKAAVTRVDFTGDMVDWQTGASNVSI